MPIADQVTMLIERYIAEQKAILDNLDIAGIKTLYQYLTDSYLFEGTVFLIANGGPAGTLDGVAADLRLHPFVSEDKHASQRIRRLRVQCLTQSPALLTGISNDLGYEHVFSEQLEEFLPEVETYPLSSNDLLIAFTGSGNSPNILNAISRANLSKVRTVLIAGRGGGKAKEIATLSIIIPGTSSFPGQTGKNDNNFHIEDMQHMIGHILTGLLKEAVQPSLT